MIHKSRRLLQMLLVVTVVFFLVFYYVTCNGDSVPRDLEEEIERLPVRRARIIQHERIERRLIERSIDANETVVENVEKSFEDFIDLSKCPPHQPISLFIKPTTTPEYAKLFEAFEAPGYATKKESAACVTIAFGGTASPNTVVIGSQNTNAIRVGPSLNNYRPGIDIIGYSEFSQKSGWIHPAPFLETKKHQLCRITTQTETETEEGADRIGNSTIKSFSPTDGPTKLRGYSFIFIARREDIEKSLRSILIVGAIPILLESSREALPFGEITAPDDYAMFIRSVDKIDKLSRISANQQFELRRNGRIFLDRYLREPKGFARGVIEVLSNRLALPLHFPFPIANPIPQRENEKFTVVIPTFKRLKTLKLMVAIFQSLDDVIDKIIIVWNSVGAPLPEGKILSKIDLQYIRPKKNSLNNRFLPWNKIETDCVLSVDDDIRVDRDNLMLGFRTWQSERDRIVSFAPRRREVDDRGKPSYSIEKHERHEFGLTGYAFLHRNYLYEYFTSMPSAFRNYVDAHRNCEDIAMNYLVAHLSRRPIMSVAFGGSLDLVKNVTGLSSRSNHLQVRTECVRFFEAAYGYNQLQSSYYQAAAHDILVKKRI